MPTNDVFQEKMTDLMQGLAFSQAYIDDLLILSTEVSLSMSLVSKSMHPKAVSDELSLNILGTGSLEMG
jgi:hypothetical protein